MRTLDEKLDHASEAVRHRVGEAPTRPAEAVSRQARTGRIVRGTLGVALLAGLLTVSSLLLAGRDDTLVATGGDETPTTIPFTSDQNPALSPEESAQVDEWLANGEPGLAALYDPTAIIINRTTDEWRMRAGLYQGQACFEFELVSSGPHGGAADCRTPSEWKVPGILDVDSQSPVYSRPIGGTQDDAEVTAYGPASIYGLVGPEVTAVELIYASGERHVLQPFGSEAGLGFSAFALNYDPEDTGMVVTVAALDATNRQTGHADAIVCAGFLASQLGDMATADPMTAAYCSSPEH
ncbi:MAG: hypothetical protein ABIJ48_04740 [Actinomycetota bacterium]